MRIPMRDFGFLNPCVPPFACRLSSTVVGAVGLLNPSPVGRMWVSGSPVAGAESNRSVPALSLTKLPSLTRRVPSARQNASESSDSARLHLGQRFIREVPEQLEREQKT